MANSRCMLATFFLLASCNDFNAVNFNAIDNYVDDSTADVSLQNDSARIDVSSPSTSVNDGSGNVSASSINFDDDRCIAKGLPVAVLLTNNTDKPTRRVTWSFGAFKENHSTDLAGGDWILAMGDANRTTDRIIQPGETFKVCSSMPHVQGDVPPDKLSYHVKVDAEF